MKFPGESLFAVNAPFRIPLKMIVVVDPPIGFVGVQPGPPCQVVIPLELLLAKAPAIVEVGTTSLTQSRPTSFAADATTIFFTFMEMEGVLAGCRRTRFRKPPTRFVPVDVEALNSSALLPTQVVRDKRGASDARRGFT